MPTSPLSPPLSPSSAASAAAARRRLGLSGKPASAAPTSRRNPVAAEASAVAAIEDVPPASPAKAPSSSTPASAAAAATSGMRGFKIFDVLNHFADLNADDLLNAAAPQNSVLATAGFEDAARRCREKVKAIARVCRAKNLHFRDPFFDLDRNQTDCLFGLVSDGEGRNPSAVKRVHQIYDAPKFFANGVSPGDIVQGGEGDCWFLAACSALSNIPHLLERVMVARDEHAGVYGFVFFRDGQWVSTVVDDQLYVSSGNYSDFWYKDQVREKEYTNLFQKGSRSLYFAKSSDENETWLPLLEKAFAKVHGDYQAINGGFGGEAIEDMTGAVCSVTILNDILDPDRFWTEELSKVNTDRLFFCHVFESRDHDIVSGHEYSVLKAVEIKGRRFVKMRNPWGKREWSGPWGDGSEEWTSEWIALLGHKFGDDGEFWMEYADFLTNWYEIERAMIFDDSWSLCRQYLEVNATVPATFSGLVFELNVITGGPAFVVLSQIDTRYFQGLEGRCDFNIFFRIVRLVEVTYTDPKTGATKTKTKEIFYAQPVRNKFNFVTRSIFFEFNRLEPGKYRVYPKVEPHFVRQDKRDKVIRDNLDQHDKLEKVVESFMLAKSRSVAVTAMLKKKEKARLEALKKAKEELKKKKEEARKKRKEEKEARLAKEKEEKEAKEAKEKEEKEAKDKKAEDTPASVPDSGAQPAKTAESESKADATTEVTSAVVTVVEITNIRIAEDKPPTDKDTAEGSTDETKPAETTDDAKVADSTSEMGSTSSTETKTVGQTLSKFASLINQRAASAAAAISSSVRRRSGGVQSDDAAAAKKEEETEVGKVEDNVTKAEDAGKPGGGADKKEDDKDGAEKKDGADKNDGDKDAKKKKKKEKKNGDDDDGLESADEEESFDDLSCSLMLRVYSKDALMTLSAAVVPARFKPAGGDADKQSSSNDAGDSHEDEDDDDDDEDDALDALDDDADAATAAAAADAAELDDLLQPDDADPNADLRITLAGFLSAERIRGAAAFEAVLEKKMKLALDS